MVAKPFVISVKQGINEVEIPYAKLLAITF